MDFRPPRLPPMLTMKRNGFVSSMQQQRTGDPRARADQSPGRVPASRASARTRSSTPRVALLLEVGYDRLTMDAVARRARASKATLYRRWDDKPSLVVDAMVRAKQAPIVEDHDTGSLRGDLLSTFCGAHGMGHKETTGVLGAVITALSSDPEFGRRFREAFIAPKVEVSREIYRAPSTAARSRPTSTSTSSPRRSRASCCTAPSSSASSPTTTTVERVIDHVILPAVGHPAAVVHRIEPGPAGHSHVSEGKRARNS